MTKAAAPATDVTPEAGILAMIGPMQESLGRFRQASEKLSSTCADIVHHQANFLQKEVFDALFEAQGLSRVRNPAEFFELGNAFAWQQAERSLKAFGELGTEMCNCWLDTLRAATDLAAKKAEKHAAH